MENLEQILLKPLDIYLDNWYKLCHTFWKNKNSWRLILDQNVKTVNKAFTRQGKYLHEIWVGKNVLYRIIKPKRMKKKNG